MQQGPHGMLPSVTHDEAAREDFCGSLRDMTLRFWRSDMAEVYEKRAVPAYKRLHGRPPQDRHEVRDALRADPFGQMASAIRVHAQELQFDAVGECVERQLPDLVRKGRKARDNNRKLGSLILDPNLVPPRYVSAVDLHRFPGSYFSDLMPDDVYAGGVFDRSFWIRTRGMAGSYGDEFGLSLVQYLKKTYPAFRPTRILDVGCTIGNSTLALCDGYPDAEIHAIDLAAPGLRYGHGRAESLGKKVHFSQQNGEHTNFPDGHFDFVIGFAILHETSTRACVRVLQECNRVLAPGGLCLQFEAPPWDRMSAFEASIHDWETHFNAEPFIGKLHDLDPKDLMVQAGYAPAKYVDIYAPSAYNAHRNVGTFGSKEQSGQHWFFGAWK